ncbi:sensitivity to high expression protein she9 [Scheffersomyces spartinae]|uniref:Sensitive to high expression protein 9, mitochondrial n=1 Tax=Scheffersomyces spartinae TaxID=45513 RepID=A0A9P8AK44_9ASCO|nr:sensitivity to high expression protein she9 [Scheffersomyces spartinae]KAG7195511.1 sensitivity to high expression protein she9 [Scheffersomyces spartinae]
MREAKLRNILEATNFGTKAKTSATAAATESTRKKEVQPAPLKLSERTLDTSKSLDQDEDEIEGLPSSKESKRSELAKKVEVYLDSIQDAIFTATRALNDVTGYSSIEKLKKKIEYLEDELKVAKHNVKVNKQKYQDAIQSQTHSQREINELLTRKHDWSSEDLERFTMLYRNDHKNEQLVNTCEKKLEECETTVDSVQTRLTQMILTKYHEEQIWSDKIRRSSTWGTWILMGINISLFVVATLIVEPWKRKRLVGAFEEKVRQMLLVHSEAEGSRLDSIIAAEKKQSTTDKTEPEPEPVDSIYGFEVMPKRDWKLIITQIGINYKALVYGTFDKVQFTRFDLGVFVSSIAFIGYCLGTIMTLIVG